MSQAKVGDTVKVHYTGKLEDGTEFDTSVNGDPLQFKLGGEQVIAGFEEAVVGMSPGEEKSTKIEADEAYGPYRDEMVLTVERESFPPNIDPTVGQMLEMRYGDDQTIGVRVIEVSDAGVTLDANHPLAGEDLLFDIQLVEIV